MKVNKKVRAIEYVQPPLTSASVERMWAAIDSPGRFSWLRTFGNARISIAVAACACLVGVGYWANHDRSTVQPAAAGDLVVTRAEPTRLRLPDDSEVEVDEASGLRILRAGDDDVRVRLSRGRARFSVSKRASRRFEVSALGLAVVVRGTRFSVGLEGHADSPEAVEVRVEEGSVEVLGEKGQRLALLGPGQSFRHHPPPAAEALPPTAVLAHEEPAILPGGPRNSPAVSAKALEASAPRSHERKPRHVDSGPRNTTVETESPQAITARALFERASAARLRGDLKTASESLAKLVRAFPKDPRMSLAAFELARIRFDGLDDPAGALRALRGVLRRGGDGVAREDAMALRIRALAKLGREEECQTAIGSLQRAFPQSPHLPQLRELCGSAVPAH